MALETEELNRVTHLRLAAAAKRADGRLAKRLVLTKEPFEGFLLAEATIEQEDECPAQPCQRFVVQEEVCRDGVVTPTLHAKQRVFLHQAAHLALRKAKQICHLTKREPIQ